MPIDQFLNLLATMLGSLGAVNVLRSILRLTPELTERIAGSHFGHNLYAIESLSSQKADSSTGAGLVLIALIVAIVNAALPLPSAIVATSRLFAIALAALITAAACLCPRLFGDAVRARNRRLTEHLVAKKYLERMLKQNPIPGYERPNGAAYAETVLHLPKLHNEPPNQTLRRIAHEVGIESPT
ncbi:MAG TPA: hypothetical protein VJK02_02875 [Anaerolineales bacterium]|nr:hypothetical protein [Anaerolineales bacterium]